MILLLVKVQQLSKKEIEDLLRKGAYGALMDEEDEGSKFCEEDIDQILQRRTHTITIESEGKGSTFAKVHMLLSLKIVENIFLLLYSTDVCSNLQSLKCVSICLQASFVATGNRTDISLEDPDFWQKWAKKAELDLDAINGRVLDARVCARARTHTRTHTHTHHTLGRVYIWRGD